MNISFIVIGYNEATSLKACLESIRHADLDPIEYEVIYVDGGSRDQSRLIAETHGVDKLLGGEKRRRAAENRNLGLQYAQGEFVQFLDGDMALDADWPKSALNFFRATPEAAAVCGQLKETNPSIIYKALQIDWQLAPGETAACGGAAMWRKDLLLQIGGFPESVFYGEEPYLCWRIRNELGYKIYALSQPMVFHDLAFRGLVDYWRRNVRVGESYAEIASLCSRSSDKFWLKEAIQHFTWGVMLLFSALLLFLTPLPFRLLIVFFFFLVGFRKILQLRKSGYSTAISIIYTVHLYGSKIPIAWGECKGFYRAVKKGVFREIEVPNMRGH